MRTADSTCGPKNRRPTRAKRSGVSVTKKLWLPLPPRRRSRSERSLSRTSTAVAVAESTIFTFAPTTRAERIAQQRVMRASEQQRVDAALLQAFEIVLDGQFSDGILGPSLFGERHQQGTRAGVDFGAWTKRLDRARAVSDATVASVPITPILPLREAFAAARAPAR